MKKILLAFALLISATSYAQVQVDTRQEFKVANYLTIHMSCFVHDADTSYVLSFRDARYSAINTYEHVFFTPKQAREFAEALVELRKDQYKSKESSVTIGDLYVMKESMLGAPYIRLSYKGAYTNFTNMNKSSNFAGEIQAFISRL